MDYLEEELVPPLSPERFREVMEEERFSALIDAIERSRRSLEGHAVWNVNSTAAGGGVAEILRSLLAYTRGAEAVKGVTVRYLMPSSMFRYAELTSRVASS